MIARKEWFERRKYGGWGVSPKTKEGIAYTLIVLGAFIIFQALPFWNMETRMVVTGLWAAFLILDLIPIMISVKRDEREYLIEAVSERNAGWFMVMILTIGIIYQIITSALRQEISVDWFLVIALFGGAIVKTISNLYLEKRGVNNE